MNTWIYVQADIIPFVVLAVILHYTITGTSALYKNYRYRILVLLVMLILIVDVANWYIMSDPIRFPWMVHEMVNVLYFLLTEIISYFWFLYVYYHINNNHPDDRQKKYLKWSIIPLFVACGIILSTPWNGLIFQIDSVSHLYTRGKLHFLQEVCGFGYILTASVLAYRQSRREVLRDRQKEFRFLCFSAGIPLLGGILQLLAYDLVSLWPFTAAALFLMYTDFQGHQISVDALTGLNNRKNMERYLQQKIQREESGWYVLMFDVNRFKVINDRYGHMEGDVALQIIANTLKYTFGKTKAFVCRYGGDEFIVITDVITKEKVDEMVKNCRMELLRECHKRKLLYTIEVSVGYVKYDQQEGGTIAEMLEKADQRMYEQKKRMAERHRL